MKIDSILLENIRSHVKTYVKFTDGFNCLVGGLGVGKSSILYAIDFALFGDPLGRSYEYILREGAETGRVALKFIENGKEYTIWRGLKRRGSHISQDFDQLKLFEGGRLLAETKNEAVLEQLKLVLGIDKDLFREIIWVRQERLKEILDMAPAERQRKIDQLFGVSDYEISWANLRSIQRLYEGELEALERDPDVIGVKELQKRYEETVKDLAENEIKISEVKKQLQETELRLKEASARLEELMEKRREIERIKAEEGNIRVKISNLEGVCSRLEKEIDERRDKINELNSRLEALNIQEDALRRSLTNLGLRKDADFQAFKLYIDSIIQQISTIQGEEENARAEIKKITQRISSLAKESKCPLCLQNLSAEYKDRLMKQFYEEISNYREQLSELEKSAKELEQLRSNLFSILSSLQAIKPKKEELSRRIDEEKSLLNKAMEELSLRRKELSDLKRSLEDLNSRTMSLDYSEIEDAQKRYNVLFEEYSYIKYEIQSLESQKNEITSRLENLRVRLENTQRKIERLENVKKIIIFIEEVRQAYRSIQPKIRGDFVKHLEIIIQQVLSDLAGPEGQSLTVRIDENYTPIIEGEGGYKRSASSLSGGERTLLALAYRLGIGQIIMHLKTGRGLSMLILDEPTESLGREDGSIDRLAEMLSRLKAIEQIIAVTHSEAFAEKANNVIKIEKSGNRSVILSDTS